jgi:hypothetical protein
VGRVEQNRPLTRLGLKDLKRWIEFVADFAHEGKAIGSSEYLCDLTGFNTSLYRLLFMAGPQSQAMLLVHSLFTGHKS